LAEMELFSKKWSNAPPFPPSYDFLFMLNDALDKAQHECGVIGVFAPNEDAARFTYFGLHALQHRGQEAAGIAASDGTLVRFHKGPGLVSQVFTPQSFEGIQGFVAIGHVRYSTSGGSNVHNIQPFVVDTRHGTVALAHNGNLTNADILRQALLEKGVGLHSTSDTGVMTMMLAGAVGNTWEERLAHTMQEWQGAYSVVMLTGQTLLAARDPWGFRPLSVGRLGKSGYAIASETGALRTIGCTDIREVGPGVLISISKEGVLTEREAVKPSQPSARCTFEHIYFSRPDAVWDALSVHHVRERLGEVLWTEAPVEADVVIPVPDSSLPAALGYARVSGIPYNDGFIKNRYIGRTFIQPTDSLRKQGVPLKFNVLPENVEGKRVVMIDDSIVRGNTSGPLVSMLRAAGAKEVHVRITCPPIQHPCFMGVDMGRQEELIAHQMSVPEMQTHFGCDSLAFLSLDGMMRALGRTEGYCNACFTGRYPFPLNPCLTQTGFET